MNMEKLARRKFFGWMGMGAATAIAATAIDPGAKASTVESVKNHFDGLSKEDTAKWMEDHKGAEIPKKYLASRPRPEPISGAIVAAAALSEINLCGHVSGVKFTPQFVIYKYDDYIPEENIKWAEVEICIGDHDLEHGMGSGYGSIAQRIKKSVPTIVEKLKSESHNDLVCPRVSLPPTDWADSISDNYITVQVIRDFDIVNNVKLTKIRVPYAYRRDTGERAWAESDRRRKEAHEDKLAEIRNRGNKNIKEWENYPSVKASNDKFVKDVNEWYKDMTAPFPVRESV